LFFGARAPHGSIRGAGLIDGAIKVMADVVGYFVGTEMNPVGADCGFSGHRSFTLWGANREGTAEKAYLKTMHPRYACGSLFFGAFNGWRYGLPDCG
jgi:hypothetical protein